MLIITSLVGVLFSSFQLRGCFDHSVNRPPVTITNKQQFSRTGNNRSLGVTSNSFCLSEVSENDVRELNSSKATGLDLLLHRFSKDGAKLIILRLL